jgi:Domain of unknown function (DUF5664)
MLTEQHDIKPYKEENPTQPQGIKYDKEKPRFDLLDPKALQGLAEVLTFGAQKYAANNWRNGIEYSRLIAALMRHLNAIQDGEDIDPESGLPHIDHLGCCWMFLSNLTKTRKDLDDRWCKANLVNTKRGGTDCVYGPCVKSGKSELQCVCDQVDKIPY